jgi:hypothetical protein
VCEFEVILENVRSAKSGPQNPQFSPCRPYWRSVHGIRECDASSGGRSRRSTDCGLNESSGVRSTESVDGTGKPWITQFHWLNAQLLSEKLVAWRNWLGCYHSNRQINLYFNRINRNLSKNLQNFPDNARCHMENTRMNIKVTTPSRLTRLYEVHYNTSIVWFTRKRDEKRWEKNSELPWLHRTLDCRI